MSSGSPSSQALKPGEASRLLSAITSAKRSLAGIERLQVQHADLVTGGVWIALDERGQVQILALLPGVIEDGGEQDVLAALDRIGLRCPAGRAGW